MEVSEQQLAPYAALPAEPHGASESPLPPRRIGRLGSSEAGPTLVCLGGVHGNEPSGQIALERVVAALERRGTPLGGEFLALLGNRQASARGVRFVDEDLNRAWSSDRLAELHAGRAVRSVEEAEMLELETEISRALERARRTVWLLDLHTTSGGGPPFGVLDDTLANREFAAMFRIPYVVGLEEELDGTLLGHYVSLGVRTFGLESGQHAEVEAIDRAEAAIWMALVGIGLIGADDVPDCDLVRRRLRAGTEGLPPVVEVRYRHAVGIEDRFRMEPGFTSFQPISRGQVLSSDRRGPVRAPEAGLLLMPLYQEQGEDGFFVVREVSGFWMRLSAWLRRYRLERYLHWLPGVRRTPGRTDGFIVDRRLARWFALELLHLLGFRRHGTSGQYLVVSRRPHDGV